VRFHAEFSFSKSMMEVSISKSYDIYSGASLGGTYEQKQTFNTGRKNYH
jgi:hypothetical protein